MLPVLVHCLVVSVMTERGDVQYMSCSDDVESATESSDCCLVNNYSLLFTEKCRRQIHFRLVFATRVIVNFLLFTSLSLLLSV